MKFEVDGHEVFASTGSVHAAFEAPSIVFVHGAALDHTVWVMIARYFARKGFNVLALDLPGHGRSAGEPLQSIDALSDWLHRVLQAREISQATFVGHSMGSLITYDFALRYPAKLKSLVLLGTAIPMPVSRVLLDASLTHLDVANRMANTFSHSSKTGPAASPGSWNLGAGQRLMERATHGVLHADFTACNDFDPSVFKGRIVAPTLIVIGAEDQMTAPRRSLEVAEMIPQAQTIRIPNCGHSMLSERPNQVLDALAGFIPSFP